jgi:hypothetical protein
MMNLRNIPAKTIYSKNLQIAFECRICKINKCVFLPVSRV